MKSDLCVLCEQSLDGTRVEFGIFGAHAGCYADWIRLELEEEEQRFDALEAQEW